MVYADIRGVPWKGGVKRQWGNRKHGLLGLSKLSNESLRHLRKWGQRYYIILFSPLSPLHRPTWPWMTLNSLNGHFTLNFRCYVELPLSNYLLLMYCRVCLHFKALDFEYDLESPYCFKFCAGTFGALKPGFRSLATLKLVVNVVSEF